MLEHLNASELTISDASGRPRIVMGLDPDDSPMLRFFDDHGRERASLGLRAPLGSEDGRLIAEMRLESGDGLVEARIMAGLHGYGAIELSQATSGADDPVAVIAAEIWSEEGRPQVRTSLRAPGMQEDWWAEDGVIVRSVTAHPPS
ncbi:MAG: hypothetical protein KGR26_08845 [Cyanobacteria bacterium REEB65]|nr:hypothetical protein [Cyanobacteria bacterium REEB65]